MHRKLGINYWIVQDANLRTNFMIKGRNRISCSIGRKVKRRIPKAD